jgi:pyruvate/2-oxoglutarate/acetoin dehydrogenase E1 component
MTATTAGAATTQTDRELRTIDAIREGLRAELLLDDRVVVLGEDVSVGGPFGATKGLVDEFGEDRIRNTPISEGTVVGLAVGAAAMGLRPVVEIMFIDFATLAMDQLVNHAAKLRYMSGGQLLIPLTVRVQGGASGAFGAQHSQSLEAWFAHVPGLKIVAPSTPADAYGLLRAAIRDDNPVLVLEHRALYWTRGVVSTSEEALVPIGRAVTRRPGRDVTLLAYSRMATVALDAAAMLAEDGIDAEVIDLRSLQPLDVDAIVESVRRTRRAVVAHEAVTFAGLGAEIAATIQSAAWAELAAPVERVGAPFAPVPASPELEASYVPNATSIAAAARRAVGRVTSPRSIA